MALPVPLRKTFDYLPSTDWDPAQHGLQPGLRVRVPFGRKQLIGILVGVRETPSVTATALRHVLAVLDKVPVLSAEHLALLEWVSRYYQYPFGEVLHASLPQGIAEGGALDERPTERLFRACGREPNEPLRAPRQAALLEWIVGHPDGVTAAAVSEAFANSRRLLSELLRKGHVVAEDRNLSLQPTASDFTITAPLELTAEQQHAVQSITSCFDRFKALLLAGVTGSGKTEVYLQVVANALARKCQVLILVPEISLIDQTIQRFQERFSVTVALVHSGLARGMRTQDWVLAVSGEAAIVIGTRSAVWTPLPRLGLIVIDEEHDASYKQQDGLRYSARDVAIVRAQRAGIPIVLGSATPSLESLHNVRLGRYEKLVLPERAGRATLPELQLVDLRNLSIKGGICERVLEQIEKKIAQKEQVLLFLNRRGYAPLVICHGCGWSAECDRCDARLVYHRAQSTLRCHHCGREMRMVERCQVCRGQDLRQLGQGTERLEQVLVERFPDARIARIDRDSTRKRGALQKLLKAISNDEVDIIVGTQMLTKGHHFPSLTLVVVVDGDAGLYSHDFRASERMAQQLVQVIGRAGRGTKPGTVMLQTHCPHHPTLQLLLRTEYVAYAEHLLAEREASALPPYTSMALLRAESAEAATVKQFLLGAKERMPGSEVTVFGPVPALLERRAGRYRWQLLVQSKTRTLLQQALTGWISEIETLPLVRKVRWSLDVDPIDLM